MAQEGRDQRDATAVAAAGGRSGPHAVRLAGVGMEVNLVAVLAVDWMVRDRAKDPDRCNGLAPAVVIACGLRDHWLVVGQLVIPLDIPPGRTGPNQTALTGIPTQPDLPGPYCTVESKMGSYLLNSTLQVRVLPGAPTRHVSCLVTIQDPGWLVTGVAGGWIAASGHRCHPRVGWPANRAWPDVRVVQTGGKQGAQAPLELRSVLSPGCSLPLDPA
jgi:hypothetical protein